MNQKELNYILAQHLKWVNNDGGERANLSRYVYIKGSYHDLQFHNGFVKIGCHSYSLEYWNIMYYRIGKDEGYTDKQIKEYKNYLNLLKEV